MHCISALAVLAVLFLCPGTWAQDDMSMGSMVDARIDSISPSEGSCAGGTRLALTGQFINAHDGDIIVQVGPYPCVVIPHYSSESVVTCYTSEAAAGAYTITLLQSDASGDYSQTTFDFYFYRPWLTPTLGVVLPQAGAPGSQVQLYGASVSQLENDCSSDLAYQDATYCLSGILFQDYRCKFNMEDIDSTITYLSFPRLNLYDAYQLTCSLPDPVDQGSLDQTSFPGLGVAKSMNVTVRFEASMQGGMPAIQPSAYMGDAQGWPYMYQLYAVVQSVSPASGSVAGGTTITVTGEGFPTLTLKKDQVDVNIDGVPCKVVSSNFTSLTCVTSGLPSGYTAPAAINGFYPGARGLEMIIYSSSVSSYANLWQLNNTSPYLASDGTSSIVTDKWETQFVTSDVFSSRSKAFFVAPTTGSYTFLMSADDYAQLNGTWFLANGTLTSTTLASLTSYSSVDNYLTYPSQTSAPISLVAGQAILLEMAHTNVVNTGFAQVGVIMPSSSSGPAWASRAEVQQIGVSGVHSVRTYQFKFSWPVGSTSDYVFNITITAADASQQWLLTDPRVGVSLTLNGNKLASFPVSASPDTIATAIKTALGISKANAGASKSLSTDNSTLTILFAVNHTALASLNATAQLSVLAVTLPTPYARQNFSMPNSCTWFNPALVSSTPTNSTFPPAAALPALDSSVLTAGASVTVAQVTVQAVAPSGSWALVAPGMVADPIYWPYNIPAANVSRMFNALTGVPPSSATVAWAVRDGLYLSNIWTISTSFTAGNNYAAVSALADVDVPIGAQVSTNVTSVASDPLGGTINVQLGSYCDSVTLDIGQDSEDAIADKIRTLPYMNRNALRSVSKSGSSEWGWTVRLTWDPVATPGDIPQLAITSSNLTGTNPVVSITTAVNGTSDFIMTPIPTEFLRLAVPVPHTVGVSVNKVPSACTSGSGPSGCTFLYDASISPSITSISPTVLDFTSVSTLSLTITGTLFSATATDNVVTVGSTSCLVTSATTTTLTCTVAATDCTAGTQPVDVLVGNVGYAANSLNVTIHTLQISSISPVYLDNSGTVMNITGRGFDGVTCGNNHVLVGSIEVPVFACAKSWVQALYNGTQGSSGTTSTADVTVQVTASGSSVTLDNTTSTAAVTLGDGTGAALMQLPSLVVGMTLPGSGFNITAQFESATTAAAVVTMWALPVPQDTFTLSMDQQDINLMAAFNQRRACAMLAPNTSDATHVICVMGAVSNGWYFMAAQLNNGTILALPSMLFQAGIYINQVTPNVGSIGGSTIVIITGSGFNSINKTSNVVLLPVPVSTTFLNGVILCDVTSATATQLTCVTRAHLAADAGPDDTLGNKVAPRASMAGQVTMVACDAGLSDILKLQCWSSSSAARAVTTNPSATTYSYAWASTPTISALQSEIMQPGQTLVINGAQLSNVAEVQLRQGTSVRDVCSSLTTSSSSLSCAIPSTLAAGVYSLALKANTGEYGVDMRTNPVLNIVAYFVSVANQAGSLAGGTDLALTINGTTWNSTTLSMNQVKVGGVPCSVVSASGSTLTCTSPSILGLVRAEYWNIPYNSWGVFPDVHTFTNPDYTSLEQGIQLNWQDKAAGPAMQPNFWVARFTFYLQIVTGGIYKFSLGADDNAKLFINDVPIGGEGAGMNVTLSPGHAKVMVTFVEYTGWASINLQWDAGLGLPAQAIPWWRIFPYAPGQPAPITATINGVPVLYGCSDTTVTIPSTNALVPTPEPQGSVQVMGPVCGFVYSSYLTPTLTTALPTVPFTSAANLTLSGQMLGSSSASDYTITIGGASCPVVEVDVVNGTTSVVCSLPAVPAGKWPVVASVAGNGYVRAALMAGSTPDLFVRYGVGVVSSTVLALSGGAAGSVSFLGGATVQLQGWGFAAAGNAQQKVMNVLYASTGSSVYPACSAVGQAALTVVSATATSMTLSVPSQQLSLCLPSFGNTLSHTTQTLVNYKINVWDSKLPAPVVGTDSTVQGALALNFNASYTPQVTSWTPTSVSPTTGSGQLTLSYYVRIGSDQGLVAGTVNGPSVATVYLQSGAAGAVFQCTTPTLTATNLTTSSFSENITCTLPAYLPASTVGYTVWVCISPMGCGYASSAMAVSLSVTSITPASGGVAGGQEITIVGDGFSSSSSDMAVSLGTVNCALTYASSSSIKCIPSAYTSFTASTATLAIKPSISSSKFVTGLNYTFDPTITPTLTSVSPTRGSTAGGTTITITGTGFTATSPLPTVSIGPNSTCSSVQVVSSTTITCTTAAPSYLVAAPLPVTVNFPNVGNAWTPSQVTYQYANLWSRTTTWGGKPPPVEGDSVFIPANTTVILDVSPPVLGAVIVQGNLYWDDTQSASTEIHLQAHYIMLMGGNLSIGSNTTVYPGKARITLHGLPDTMELPQYGSKAIGVRDGYLVMRGQPKTPTWTLMANTADVGSSSITVQGAINWAAGDLIAIASSSFFANETDSATIVSSSYDIVTHVTTITLDQPLNYTHLGVTVPVPGDVYGRTIDMRAEVVVLTRNIVVQGDDTSADTLFGGQIMVNTPRSRPRAQMQLEQVELHHMGQAFRLGRYTLHWHMHGDTGYGSWLKGVAIHHTYNRACTIHGTHNVTIQNSVSYDTMGHAWFLEDGIETGNIYLNNVGILTRRSDALLNTDTTPAIFWVTNPNNTYRNNRAAGSTNGYGFWYRMLKHPEGPSYTTSVCPKFTPMGEFTNNVAHSNMFYGLRIHPEYMPQLNPCSGDPDDDDTYIQVPATYQGLLSYKNGMKGMIATQCGLLRFANMTLADNGGGPRAHIVTGKDNGANYELTWVVDDRNRANVNMNDMAGLYDSLLVSKTQQGNVGTAGNWPSSRKITGVNTHSPAEFHVKHTALAVLSNVTFVNYSSSNPVAPQFSGAIESCGKCKNFQGGATTFTRALTFLQQGLPHLSEWSWGHQGIFQDTDGTLLNANTLPADLVAAAPFAVGVPNTTWHSGVDSELFDPAECVYVRNRPVSNNGVFCSNALKFRRVMLHDHQPPAIMYRPLLVTTAGGAFSNTTRYNGTSTVFFQHYNEDGYQFTLPTQRDYYIHWQNAFRVDPLAMTIHKPDPYDSKGWVTLTERLIQQKYSITVNGNAGVLTSAPVNDTMADGSCFYNSTFSPDPWWYGNNTYNATAATVYIPGNVPHARRYWVSSNLCPPAGCNNLPDNQIDIRAGVLLWSDNATWVNRQGGKPKDGDNVTIPYGWNLVIDENPKLQVLIVQGNVTFDFSKPITLTANYILVMNQGVLSAGTSQQAFNGSATIQLNGTRQTPDWPLSNDLNLGSKVLAAVRGGTINLFGQPVAQRWTRLATDVAAGSSSISLAQPMIDWPLGGQVLVTSTSWNPWQAEVRTITGVSADGLTLTLDSALTWSHTAKVVDILGASNGAFDMRAEVGLISSNVKVTAMDGAVQRAPGGEMFGGRVLANGASILRVNNAQLDYCGQGGLLRSSLMFIRMEPIDPVAFNLTNGNQTGPAALIPNPSFVSNTAITNSMDGGLEVESLPGNPISVTGNVLYISFDRHTVSVTGTGNLISGNLALGTIKDMTGKSGFDKDMPSTFNIVSSNNIVVNNVAAGGERVGFMYMGIPCSSDPAALARYSNNSAHSYLVGAWLKSSDESDATGCTTLYNFTTYLNWDFGVISTDGITTDVEVKRVNIADSKFANILILRKGDMTTKSTVKMSDMTLVGMSGNDVCDLCNTRVDSTNMDPGCHPKLARTSYNQQSPFTPVKGFLGSVFALKFTPGPEPYPWDGLKGYEIVHGATYMTRTTLAHFWGSQGCEGGYQAHALGNHQKAPEAFHPVFMTQTNLYDVQNDGLFKFYGPDAAWRSEDACNTINWSRDKQMISDNDSIQSQITAPNLIQLTCTGPLHVHFRDVDGTLTGKVSSMLGYNPTARSLPFDMGTPLLPGPCQRSQVWNGYQCVTNSTNYELDAAMKPSPIPPAGIFGDPQHFVLESRDADSEDRNFSPVFFNVSGSVELATPAMDHAICFSYKGCQKRLSTFWTYLPSGHVVNISFTGTPSRNFRLFWPYADANADLVLVVNMQNTPNRRFTWTASQGRINPLAAPPAVGDANPHGSYYWEQSTTLMYIKLKGSAEPVELRTENALMASQSLAVSFDQWFDVKEMFLSNLAFLLGIPLTRIQVVSIVPGSINLKYLLYDLPNTNPIAEPTFNTDNTMDAQTKAAVANMPPDQQAQWITDATTPTGTSPSPAPSPAPSPSSSAGPSLVDVITKFAKLPGSIGNITVLASSLDLTGALLDPAILAQVYATLNISSDRAVTDPLVIGPTSAGTSSVPGGSTASPSPAVGGGKTSNKYIIVGAVVGGVLGAVAVAAIAAIVVMRQRAAKLASQQYNGAQSPKPTRVMTPRMSPRASPRVTPLPSEAGVAPTDGLLAASLRAASSAPGVAASMTGPSGFLPNEPKSLSPLSGARAGSPSGLASPRYGSSTGAWPSPTEPGNQRAGSPFSPNDQRAQSPGSPGSPHSAPLMTAAPSAGIGSRGFPVQAFTRNSPAAWDAAATGRAALPALQGRPDTETGILQVPTATLLGQPVMGHNVMYASSSNGAADDPANMGPMRLPGSTSMGPHGAAGDAAASAVNAAPGATNSTHNNLTIV